MAGGICKQNHGENQASVGARTTSSVSNPTAKMAHKENRGQKKKDTPEPAKQGGTNPRTSQNLSGSPRTAERNDCVVHYYTKYTPDDVKLACAIPAMERYSKLKKMFCTRRKKAATQAAAAGRKTDTRTTFGPRQREAKSGRERRTSCSQISLPKQPRSKQNKYTARYSY